MSEELVPGAYESLVTTDLRARLDRSALPIERVTISDLDAEQVPDRIARHLGAEIARALSDVDAEDRPGVAADIVRQVVEALSPLTGGDASALLADPPSVLDAILRSRPDNTPEPLAAPQIPLLDTTLLTNAPGEPTLWSQLQSEIASADGIDVVMAFVRRSGINPLLAHLRRHCEAGRSLRVLTTTYTGTTEAAALDLLQDLGAEIRLSYDLGSTRLHAKAWLFHRNTGLSTAYVGSSNLTQTAQVTGLEWNLRSSAAKNPEVLEKFRAVFDSYWASGDFVPYEPQQFAAEHQRTRSVDQGPEVILSPIELRPEPFQERLLELLEMARERGHHRNLLVAATGTGKTVMAAVDYARLRTKVPRARLLFIAHRDEILNQSLATFRYALRSASFGEKWTGQSKPTDFDHVFASIQTLAANGLESIDPAHFDVVIVDEFHHAAAPSYERVLERLHPTELLGLTATPERADGMPILQWFGDRIAAELRLWDAIDQQHLAPFMYFGIHDGIDLRDIPWKRGQGYDIAALSNTYTSNDAWARLVLHQLSQRVTPATMRCLGFCVSVQHAHFMARHFNEHGVPSVAVSGETPWPERQAALEDLAAGRVKAVFSVDLFNEGVDVPAVDTVLMLRPTESPTLFLQQLGRGLRRAPDKAFCTVLDFVGMHRREFRFDRRYRALLGGTRRELERTVEQRFPYLPSGCHLELDQKATEVVLRSLREAIPSRWPAKVEELRSLRQARAEIDLAGFLDESGLELDDIYDGSRSWSDLCDDAGAPTRSAGSHEKVLRRAIGRLLHIDDALRIDRYLELLAAPSAPSADALSEIDRRLLRMLATSVAGEAITKATTLQEAADLLWAHPQVRHELRQLLPLLEVDHLQPALATHPDAPLRIHARYTRAEILSALDVVPGAKVAAWQSGVYEAKRANAELFAFTLDKGTGNFSPTTRYRDYAISPSLIHWESQSATREDSPTGLRYRNHECDGRHILLFTRLRTTDRAFWFLGPATYVSHEGERPMAITWRLHHDLPGDLFAEFAAAV